jgi:ribonuclease HI
VYTDASVLPDDDNEAGVGAVIYCTEHERILHSSGIYISRVDSPTTAELVAIIHGMNQVRETIDSGSYTPKLIRIISDCTAALDLASGEGSSDNEGISDLLEILDEVSEKINCPIEFQWVKAHSNHRMNDLADYLAYHHARG